MQIGSAVTYVDEFGQPHAALVTNVFGDPSVSQCAINVVYVSPDETEHDQYGRQIRRTCSVSHEDVTTALGRFYRPL